MTNAGLDAVAVQARRARDGAKELPPSGRRIREWRI